MPEAPGGSSARPTLVMVHGLIGSSDYFDPAERISAARVVTIDLHGYGERRETSATSLSLARQAHLVAQRLEDLGGASWLLGHSMGGAIVMLAASHKPGLVAGIINVEGNFTHEDAFWSRNIAAMSIDDWRKEWSTLRGNITAWLSHSGIEPTDQRMAWGKAGLDFQPAETVYAMSQAILRETADPSYLDAVQHVIDADIPMHLIAGQRSAHGWDVPPLVRDAARSYTEIGEAGHLMMMEQPDAYCRAVEACIPAA